jgi:4-hydroxy-3-methylbut-2-enyl diphosphate reductase
MATIDADAHVVESDRTWEYLDPADLQYRPRLVHPLGEPRASWFIDGKLRGLARPVITAEQFAEVSRQAGRKIDTPEETREVDRLDQADPAVPLVISARGIPPSTLEEAKARGYQIVQGTCPFVVSQERHATNLVREGYDVVFCGSPEQHGVPRLRDIVESAGKRFFVAEREGDVAALPKMGKVGVMAQTTQSLHNLQGVVRALLARCHEVKVVNSICGDSIPRQASAREVAERVDVMLVLGESWSASRMLEECQRVNSRVHRAVRPEQLQAEWFRGAATVGVAAGNATPEWLVPRFAERIQALAAAASGGRPSLL